MLGSSYGPFILIKIEYSEKQDTLYLSIRYKGDEYFDPATSESKLFQLLLSEQTTTVSEKKLTDDPDGCLYQIDMSFKWVEE